MRLVENQQGRVPFAEYVETVLLVHRQAVRTKVRPDVQGAHVLTLLQINDKHRAATLTFMAGSLDTVMADIGKTVLRVDDELVGEVRQANVLDGFAAGDVVETEGVGALLHQQKNFLTHGLTPHSLCADSWLKLCRIWLAGSTLAMQPVPPISPGCRRRHSGHTGRSGRRRNKVRRSHPGYPGH
ncbi:hypothetical protein D3C76_1237570 [compost metagenome]